MASKDWKSFWRGYRTPVAHSEDDLFLQVGKTIDSKPIERAVLAQMVAAIVRSLKLTAQDRLLDLCCGNGLLSFELALTAAHVTSVDFAPHMIQAAHEFKMRPNIEYRVDDVLKPVDELVGSGARINKVLMNDSLAYFDADGLSRLLGNLQAYFGKEPVRFLMTGIPNYDLRWNFYNTPERRARFEDHERRGDDTNDGMGRWWRPQEITRICELRGLSVEISNQPYPISTYRMNALVTRE